MRLWGPFQPKTLKALGFLLSLSLAAGFLHIADFKQSCKVSAFRV